MTATVLVVALSASGVRTLDIIPAPSAPTGARPAESLTPDDATVLRERQRRVGPATVDVTPVKPEVREVPLRGVQGPEGATPEPQAQQQQQTSPATRLVARSAAQGVTGYATVGVSWKAGANYAMDQIAVEVRTQEDGRWSGWSRTEYDGEHAPDPREATAATQRAALRVGTDPTVIGDVDQVQVRTLTADGTTPPDLEVALIDPGKGRTRPAGPALDTSTMRQPAPAKVNSAALDSAAPSSAGAGTAALSAMQVAPKPRIFSRAQWGANESLRSSAPAYGTIKAGFIHHTVNANDYKESEVPSLLRGIYAYHTQVLGWSDIGYNFLVDRFGRIWEGRYGGVDRAVLGAHTRGYNGESFAMSAIGNFEIAKPPQAVLDAYASLMAWKLSLAGVKADATGISVNGKTLQGINGHSDAGSTACPGRYLYARIPEIRRAAARIQAGAAPVVPVPTPAPSTTFTSPTQTPRAAKPQPAGAALSRHPNLVGSSQPDLVLRRQGTGQVVVLPTEGQTGLGTPVSTPVRWTGRMSLLAAAGDLTGDGKGDLVGRAVRDNTLRVYRGDGSGRIATTGIGATQRFAGADLLVGAGDWDRDGRNDLLVRRKATGALFMVKGRGDGTFGASRVVSESWRNVTSTAPVGDVTGDGRADVMAVRAGVSYLVRGTSTGALGTWTKVAAPLATYPRLVGAGSDLDGDGRGDAYGISTKGSVGIVTGTASGGVGPTLGAFPGGAGTAMVSAGPMTGSSQADLVGLVDNGTRVVVVPHNGRRNVSPLVTTDLELPAATQVFAAGDWNRDGKGDLITRQNEGDTLKLRLGTGAASFAAPIRLSQGWKSFTALAAVGDVTGDRNPDLIGRTASGKATIFPGDGDEGFLAPILAPASLRTFNQIGSGAFRPGAMPGSTFVSPDGSFVPFVASAGTAGKGYNWTVGPGDVDGDGRADLVSRDSSGTLWLRPGTATGLGPRRYMTSGLGAYDLGG